MADTAAERVWMIGHGRALPLAGRPLVMGILNVTPDSFSDGGMFERSDDAVAQGLRLARAGSDIIDVGGESTRPGSEPVDAGEQIARTRPVIEQLAAECEAAISIDTRLAEVARSALDAGAHIVNDVSAFRDDDKLAATAARREAGVVLMHMLGTPADMQQDPSYNDVVAEVAAFLADRAEAALAAGVRREAIAIDPGIGFGKTTEHNLALLGNLDGLAEAAGGWPVLLGPSRKRFIGEVLGVPVPERLAGTVGACVAAVAMGVRIFRVHDPAPVRQAVTMAWEILQRRR